MKKAYLLKNRKDVQRGISKLFSKWRDGLKRDLKSWKKVRIGLGGSSDVGEKTSGNIHPDWLKKKPEVAKFIALH